MNKSDFKKYMQRGLGRCIMEMSENKDIEKYREIILWGCLHNISYDTMCEGTRAAYLYYLVSFYEDDGYFLTPLIEKFEKLPAHLRGWDYQHFCELLCSFADAGNEPASIALHKKYDELYNELLSDSKGENYSRCKENFEHVCIAISSLEGLDAFLKISSDIGNLYLRNKKLDCSDFLWFYGSFEDIKGKKSLNSIIERESKKNPAIKAFYDNIKTSREPDKRPLKNEPLTTAEEIIKAVDNGKFKYINTVRFKYHGVEEQKLILKQAVINETNPDKKAELLECFEADECPVDIEELISYAKSGNEKLSRTAFLFLDDIKNDSVRNFAIELLNREQNINKAICMLVKNYEKQDKDLLLNSLNKVKIDYSRKNDWFWVVSSILFAFNNKIKLPKETLYFIYNNSLDSYYREWAVQHLIKHRWITDEIRAECAFDSNDEIRNHFNTQK